MLTLKCIQSYVYITLKGCEITMLRAIALRRVYMFFLLTMIPVSILSPGVSYADSIDTSEQVNININGQRINPDVSAFVQNGRTMAPLSAVFKKLGADVQWVGSEQKVVVNYNNTKITLWIGNKQAEVNSNVRQMEVAPVIVNNRTMVPLRFISENIVMKVGWLGSVKLVTITAPKYFDNIASNLTVLGFTTSDYSGDQRSLNSLEKNDTNINTVATFSYCMDTNGNLGIIGASQQNTVDFANSNQIKSLVLVNNYTENGFDRNIAHEVLSDASKRKVLINNILKVMSNDEYMGVNIDIESVYWYDRDNYTALIKELKDRLTPLGFLTTVSIPAKSYDSYKNDNWSGAFDYGKIGQYADQVTIMTYDEHYISGEPGPVASLPWVQNVLTYAANQIDSKKILLGIPGYGYDWSKSGSKAVAFKEIGNIIDTYNGNYYWDDSAKSPYIAYIKSGAAHTVWYEDEKSLEYKLNLVATYHLGGIGIWKLGYDDKNFWDTVRGVLN